MSDLVGESLTGQHLPMVLTLTPMAWLLVDLALLEPFGFSKVDFQFDNDLRKIYLLTLVVYMHKRCGIKMFF